MTRFLIYSVATMLFATESMASTEHESLTIALRHFAGGAVIESTTFKKDHGRDTPLGSLLHYFDPLPQPEVEVRATVTKYENGLLVISIGLDGGVGPGTELEISRIEGGGKYIGTLKVIDATPKNAVAKFIPPFGKPLNRLKVEDFPKAGDRVYKPTK